MNEYDELIESCRACASGFNTNCDRCMFCGKDYYENTCFEQLHRAAADAIEELSYKYQKALDDLVKQAYPPKEET